MLLTLQQQCCKQKTKRGVQTGQVNLEILSNKWQTIFQIQKKVSARKRNGIRNPFNKLLKAIMEIEKLNF